MFCDLVGSTALSEKLDPEELRSLLHAYRTLCGDVIARYDGFVARYVGDGILTYFGWPTAHEEDAERAVRAALEIFIPSSGPHHRGPSHAMSLCDCTRNMQSYEGGGRPGLFSARFQQRTV